MQSSLNVVPLLDWWKGSNDDASNRLPLIDLRESQENGSLDSGNAVIVHLPFSTLNSGERSCELPPRHVKFAVLVDEAEATLDEAAEFFGRTVSQATQQSRKPWLVEEIVLVNEDLWISATLLGILIDTSKESSGPTHFQPLARLWQPDPMIPELLWPLLKSRFQTIDLAEVPLEIWDLGSGAGRDVTFLAEQIKVHGFKNIKLVGVDNHKGSADRCLPLWNHRGVSDITSNMLLDLNKVPAVEEALGAKRIACLFAVRFWNPKLIRWLATKASLGQNTIFAMSHFCKTGPIWTFDHPKENRVIQRDELRTLFSNDWEILHDQIASDGDEHGRTLIQFVARKC
jgi:hypothetical protein